ncbi:MAG: phosphotransferase [Mariprofundaceae bacterium]
MAASRELAMQHWLTQILAPGFVIRPLAGDASFRRYFRVHERDGRCWVLMDAPPEHEDVKPFLAVRNWLQQAGLRVSALKAENLQDGFLLLEDFGDRTWATELAGGSDASPMFSDALRQLYLLQQSDPGMRLAAFDVTRMQRECDLYLDWYLPRVAGVDADQKQREAFHAGLLPLLETLAALPAVPVHLDYHSRNLMLPADGLPLAVIDFQDALYGPVTYDLASLLYDCYQDYPEPLRLHWSGTFFAALPGPVRAAFGDAQAWHRLLRLTALQRHIKAIGIFARLACRDGKRQFLDEIPLTRKHLADEMMALDMTQEQYPLLFMPPEAAL